MPTEHILQLLIQERDKLNRAIEALGGGVPAKRRGRPPKKPMAAAEAASTSATPYIEPKRKGRTWTAAQKRAAAERMAARWAKKKTPGKKAAK